MPQDEKNYSSPPENSEIYPVNTEVSGEQPVNSSNLTKSQKIATAILAFFAFIIIIFWFSQFQRSLSSPFQHQGNSQAVNRSVGGNTCTGPNCPANEETRLKAQDTDQDGLTDYDETYLYQTSPYLEDTDSDGVWDKEEIDGGQDPNCPIGRDCSAGSALGADNIQPQNTLDDTINDAKNTGSLLDNLRSGSNSVNDISQDDLNALLGDDFDASTLRQLLLANGMQKELLDQISDQDLMSSFMEVISEQ